MTRLGALAVCAGAPALLLLLAVAAAQDDVGSIITESMFESMLPKRGNGDCAGGFYTYDAFIAAAKSFPAFGTSGASAELTRRELAAFFGQTSHETTGGTEGRSDQFEWGYCYKEEISKTTSAPYYGRGPIQLTGESNYELAGKALNRPELVSDPDLVSTDPVVSFQTAIWFWMTPQGNKPSCHDVILGNWAPGEADRAAGRVPGYGVITNIINGARECGMGQNKENVDRIGYYTRYRDMLGTTPGDSLDCYSQRNFCWLENC